MLTHTLITDLHDSYLSKLLRMALPQGKDRIRKGHDYHKAFKY